MKGRRVGCGIVRQFQLIVPVYTGTNFLSTPADASLDSTVTPSLSTQCFLKAIPKSTLLPRTRLQGGFVMDRDTAIEWVSRIGHERLTKDDSYWVWEIIEDKLTPYGSESSFVGEELDAEFMIVTRSAVLPGAYLGMDPSLIPQFKEGEQENLTWKLLEEEGLGHLEFATCLD